MLRVPAGRAAGLWTGLADMIGTGQEDAAAIVAQNFYKAMTIYPEMVHASYASRRGRAVASNSGLIAAG